MMLLILKIITTENAKGKGLAEQDTSAITKVFSEHIPDSTDSIGDILQLRSPAECR